MTLAQVIEAEAFARKQREKLARLKCAAAAQRIGAGIQPRCDWYGQHRYTVIDQKDGMVIEACMDCGGRPRSYPLGLSSKHAKVIDLPENLVALDAAGSGRAIG